LSELEISNTITSDGGNVSYPLYCNDQDNDNNETVSGFECDEGKTVVPRILLKDQDGMSEKKIYILFNPIRTALF